MKLSDTAIRSIAIDTLRDGAPDAVDLIAYTMMPTCRDIAQRLQSLMEQDDPWRSFADRRAVARAAADLAVTHDALQTWIREINSLFDAEGATS